MNPTDNFGRRLFEIRQSLGVSRKDLAARAQISIAYLEKIERCYSPPPSTSTIQALAKALKINGDELFALAGKIPPDLLHDLTRSPLRVQLLRVASTWRDEDLQECLRFYGIREEEFAPASTCRLEMDDERQTTREIITAAARKAVFARDNHECVYCSAPSILEVDHIHPFSLGGTNEPENLITACHKCNLKKKNLVAPFPMVFGRFKDEIK